MINLSSKRTTDCPKLCWITGAAVIRWAEDAQDDGCAPTTLEEAIKVLEGYLVRFEKIRGTTLAELKAAMDAGKISRAPIRE